MFIGPTISLPENLLQSTAKTVIADAADMALFQTGDETFDVWDALGMFAATAITVLGACLVNRAASTLLG